MFFKLLLEFLFITKEWLLSFVNKTPPEKWGEGTKGDIVLIPGQFGNWYYLRKIGNFLNSIGYKIHLIKPQQRNIYPLEYCARKIEKLIKKNNLRKTIILSHSKGGIIARKLLTNPQIEKRVKLVFCIATPHGGTIWGILGFLSLGELTPWSKLIIELNNQKIGIKKIVNIYPKLDSFIIPNRNLFLPGAKNIKIDVVGHLNILNVEETLNEIKKLINA